MQEDEIELAYNHGYRDGLRFLFTLQELIDRIPKEVWEAFGAELKVTNQRVRVIEEHMDDGDEEWE
jgi:hypothetical protein